MTDRDPSEIGMSSLMMQAAQSAAQADGVAPPGRQTQMKKKGPPLRRGKWTPEEEAYANRLIQEFKAGLLPLTDGTTLRTFLSRLLNCDPMRISKKFVGNNCIGKQVFRRRTADLNRLTPEQIQQSRAELSDLERRFLERVEQTNRVKSGVAGAAASAAGEGTTGKPKNGAELQGTEEPPSSPQWLQPPYNYTHGNGASFAAANLTNANSRAAAAGRALLGGLDQQRQRSNQGLSSSNSAGMLAAMELQRRASRSSFMQNPFNQNSQNNFFSGSQMGQNSSAAHQPSFSSNASMNNLMMKTGLSRDQLSQIAQSKGLSSNSLSNMIQRQNSFDALMSLDFQSLQSIDNLANLIQSGGMSSSSHVPVSSMKNEDFNFSNPNLASNQNRMDALLRSMSNNNMPGSSNANLQQYLANSSNNNLAQNSSMASLFQGNSQSAAGLANLLRQDSSTGLTALRMQEGLNQRNTSVDDFLSLMASGDIPHQDPSLLDIPLMHQQLGSQEAAAKFIAQQQMLGNSALANALASRSFGNLQGSSTNSGNMTSSASAAALAMAQARAAGHHQNKRTLEDALGGGGGDDYGSNKKDKRHDEYKFRV